MKTFGKWLIVSVATTAGVYVSAATVAHHNYWAGLVWQTYLADIPAVDLISIGTLVKKPSASVMTGVMVAEDRCPKDDNKIIVLSVGDRVQAYESIGPVDKQEKNLPPDSPLSKRVNLTYVKATTGANAGEYCWISTVNMEINRY